MEDDAGRQAALLISAADGGVLSIAGLWDRWQGTDIGETVGPVAQH